MNKNIIVVVCCSLVIIALFTLSCYLMYIVNPAQMPPMADNDTDYETLSASDYDQDLILRDVEKMDDVETNQYVARILSRLNFTTETTGTERTKKDVDFTSIALRSPLWHKPKHVLTNFGNENPKPLDEDSTTTHQSISIKDLRRSIKNNDMLTYNNELKNADEDAVVLKVLDDSGKSRIEIKLGAKGHLRLRRDGNPAGKLSNLTVSLKESENTSLIEKHLSMNTVIELMPNNTVVIQDAEVYYQNHKKNNTSLNTVDTKSPIVDLITNVNIVNVSTNAHINSTENYEYLQRNKIENSPMKLTLDTV